MKRKSPGGGGRQVDVSARSRRHTGWAHTHLAYTKGLQPINSTRVIVYRVIAGWSIRGSLALGCRCPHVLLGRGLRLGVRELLVRDRASALAHRASTLAQIQQEAPRAARALATLRHHGARVHALPGLPAQQRRLIAKQPGARLREHLRTEGDVVAQLPQDDQRGDDHAAHLQALAGGRTVGGAAARMHAVQRGAS